jgi:xylan 1,4-beta-xylosidase
MAGSLTALALSGFAVAGPAPAIFDWFSYTGRDAVFAPPLAPGEYRNPILAGFYPDPSICRVGADYYLANSSFTYFPGIPIFHSRDLVHWAQLGHVITRPAQANFDSLEVSRGVFAPALCYHAGLFYLVTTLVDCGGNCIFTARDPAGPWSDPIWLPQVDGIDSSLFFGTDGRAWLVNNGPPVGPPRYDGHRAIWLQEFSPSAQELIGPRSVIIDGGTDLRKQPVWIEAPHLFERAGWHYLICAEGGTAENHSEVVFRSRGVAGPWQPGHPTPILTQRDLSPRRLDPVTCTGHADFVVTPAGEWWAVFLGCRPYAGDRYNTGRETFMLPVTWQDGWPSILPAGERVPFRVTIPRLAPAAAGPVPLTGNFTWRDEFDGPVLAPTWNFLRNPRELWWSLTEVPGALALQPRAATLSGRGNPSFIGRRVQHGSFSASTALRRPVGEGVSAGLAVFQSESSYFFLSVRRQGGAEAVVLERASPGEHPGWPHAIAQAPLSGAGPVQLRVEAHGRDYAFAFAAGSGGWQAVGGAEDGSILSTAVAGGFVGSYVGLYARRDASGP